jgi:hypothetical protein
MNLEIGNTALRGGKSPNPFWEASVSVKYFLPDCVLPAKPSAQTPLTISSDM